MAQLATPILADLNERKAIGRAHLEANRVEDALRVYARILRDYPDDVDAYLFLGDCYLADGDAETALLLYSQGLDHNADHPEVHRRIALARGQCVERWSTPEAIRSLSFVQGETIPTNAQAVVNLLQTLSPQSTPVTEADVMRATRLLDEIIHCPHPAQVVSERLEEIDALLPALLELNIRQARADGRPDLAQALQNLLNNIRLQLNTAPGVEAAGSQPTRTAIPQHASPAIPRLPAELRVLFLGPAPQDSLARPCLPAEALAELGCRTTVTAELSAERAGQFDVVVAHRPHSDIRLMEGLAACAAAKTPLILDLDAAFDQMPLDHVEYEGFGLSTPGRARAYAAALLLADVIRVPCETLAASLSGGGQRVEFIPDGWSQRNDLWDKPASPRHTINLGWMSSPGQLEDVFQVRRIIIRILREFPHVRLAIGGDLQVYRLFDTLPESRRLFLPTVSQEDYPYLLAQMDILMVPLRNTPFNRMLPDRRLMEAGVRGIPWIASPIPAFASWNAGGIIAKTTDEWHTYLRQLVLDARLRASLGQAGRQRAAIREMSHLGPAWLSLIEKAAAEKAGAERSAAEIVGA
jgi:glycosyltransferase involved in cell wall biosynthesis